MYVFIFLVALGNSVLSVQAGSVGGRANGKCPVRTGDSGITCGTDGASCLADPNNWVWGVVRPDGSQSVTIKNCIPRAVARDISLISVSECDKPCTRNAGSMFGDSLFSTTLSSAKPCSDICTYLVDNDYKNVLPNPYAFDRGERDCLRAESDRCSMCTGPQFEVCMPSIAGAEQTGRIKKKGRKGSKEDKESSAREEDSPRKRRKVTRRPVMKKTSKPTLSNTDKPVRFRSKRPTRYPKAKKQRGNKEDKPGKEDKRDGKEDKKETGSSASPVADPTATPSNAPVADLTSSPSADPSADPSAGPSADPSADPTVNPTADPSLDPSADPSADPTLNPSAGPSADPTFNPTAEPSEIPTFIPSRKPTFKATTRKPTLNPTASKYPTRVPTGLDV